MFSKEHPKVRDDLQKEVIDQIETFTPILKRTNSPLMKVLEILTEIEDGGKSASKTEFVHRDGDKAGIYTAMFGVTTKTANDVLGTTFGKGDSITTEQAIKVVEEARKENLKDIDNILKNSTIKLTPEQKIVMTILTHNAGMFSVKFPAATRAFKANDINQAKIEMFSRAKGANNVKIGPKKFKYEPGLFKKNNMLLGLFERFSK
jgi:GH24 family phage-related lysozyme (muramidase)